MRFVMFTYPDPELAAVWDSLPPEETQADVERHVEWFRRHRERVLGGEELGWPQEVRTIRRRKGETVVTDGPFVESKEILGGFVVIEAPDLDAALRMAETWPSLDREGGAVSVWPVFVREPSGSGSSSSGAQAASSSGGDRG